MSPSPGQLADQFRSHFAHRGHLYGVLLAEMADDLDGGGPLAEICRDHLDADRGAAIQLRLLAGLFRIVLRGDAPQLEAFYPNLGGYADPEDAWPLVREVLTEHLDEIRAGLQLAPQTNEVGRSAALAIGLFEAVRAHGVRRIRLLEPGASAGLNLNVDRYAFSGPGWTWGSANSDLALDTEAAGVRPEELSIVERRGCDLAPVDAATASGGSYLTSFVWPMDLARHGRLAAALQIARRHPVQIDRAPAAAWVAEQLAHPVDDGVLTVVWQSITEQYWPASESAGVGDAIKDARSRMPISHITLEGVPPSLFAAGYDVALHGPMLEVDGRPIARSHHHGPPVVLVNR